MQRGVPGGYLIGCLRRERTGVEGEATGVRVINGGPMKISFTIRYPDFDKMTSEIQCTKCGKPFTEKLSNLRPGYTRTCPNCGILIEFTGDNVAQKIKNVLDSAFK